jgi:hypothetical protein
MCGLIDLTCLVDVKASLLEAHHALGRAHAPDLTIPVCRNCHAVLSAAQLDDEVPLAPQPNLLARLLAVVAALGSLLRMLAEALLAWAAKGRQFVAGLDTDFPTWRAKPWAA